MRNSNIELLRLLCILGIISMHIFGLYTDELNFAGLAALSFNNAICNLGVSIFMLISGYYGIRYKTEKLLNLWNIAVFWSITLVLFDTDYSAKNLLRSVFPVLTGKYWFLTAYVVIYCLSPYIEVVLKHITKKEFQYLIAVLLFFFVFAPSILMLEILKDSGKGILNMFAIYLIGRYFAIYKPSDGLSQLQRVGVLGCCILLVAGGNLAVTLLLGKSFQMLARDNSIFILLGAIVTFLIVTHIKPTITPIVNKLASYVFPVYIIHYILLQRLVFMPHSLNNILYLMIC